MLLDLLVLLLGGQLSGKGLSEEISATMLFFKTNKGKFMIRS